MEPVTLMVGVAVPTAVVALSIAVASYLYYSCWFQQVDIEVATPPVRSLVIMYKFGKGSYNNVTNTLIALNKIAPEEDTVVIYYDDDNKVAPEKLRWVVGVIIAEGSEPIDDDLKYRLQIAGCKRHTLPCASMSVQTEVELTTKLSYHFVTKKVYPKLNDYIETKKLDAYPVIEIYEDDTLNIMAPLDNQDGFYVPEAARQR